MSNELSGIITILLVAASLMMGYMIGKSHEKREWIDAIQKNTEELSNRMLIACYFRFRREVKRRLENGDLEHTDVRK